MINKGVPFSSHMASCISYSSAIKLLWTRFLYCGIFFSYYTWCFKGASVPSISTLVQFSYIKQQTKGRDNMWRAINMPTFVFCGVLGSTKIYSKHLWIMFYIWIPCYPRTHTCDDNRGSTHMVTVNKRRDQHTLSWRSMVLETRVHWWCHQDLLRGCLLIIATSSMILVSRLACKLKQRSNDAALFSGKNLMK